MGYKDNIAKLKRLMNAHNQSHHNPPKLPIIQRDVKSIGSPITTESSSCLIPSRINILIDIRLNPNFSSILKVLKRLAGKSINEDRTITDIITIAHVQMYRRCTAAVKYLHNYSKSDTCHQIKFPKNMR